MLTRLLTVIGLALGLAYASASFAEEASIQPQTITSKMSDFPVADDPRADEYDWLQIYTGEWVKGQFVAIYSEAIAFISTELGTLTFPMTEVRSLRTANPREIKNRQGEIFEGRILLREGQVYVLSEQDVLISSFPVASIMTVASTEESERMLWRGALDVGATWRTGNTESVDYSAQFEIERRTVDDLLWFRYMGAMSETNGKLTEESHRINTSYDLFFDSLWYYRPVWLEVLKDEIQNINYRVSATTGGGYFFLKSPKMRFSTGLSVGGQYTNYIEPTLLTGTETWSPVLQGDSTFFWQVGPRVDYQFNYVVQLVDERAGQLLHFLTTGFDFRWSAAFGFGVDLTYNRVQKPPRQKNLRRPDQNDTRVDFSLFYRF